MVTDKSFILTEEALTAIACHDSSFLSGLLDELHQAAETLITELEVRILSSTTYREHSEQTPCLKSQGNQIFLELRQ
jgi:hypothetical protein